MRLSAQSSLTDQFGKDILAQHLNISGEIFKAESVKGNTIISKYGKELLTCVFHPVCGNLELQASGEDTGFDIKGKWFKPGTRLTDAENNDLIVVTADV